ncbi:MAG TPA: bifunctional demethylmenaquinone methyltransferase/2-methoxy-6-polyprenyl-1,4-benzoquinol methylase UbiE [Bdellovibrionales bacterium]|nr:bifunctional demethylmenaquinone methyltransferase/2-methoxy-6-polyprenyl-1,4-benzoquinol methylase UbiE [Bdellovibrionales bacterium]
MSAQGPQPEEIRDLFASVADGYDRANDAMTFGLAHVWRRKVVSWSSAQTGDRVLDCATGTGDLALEFKKTVGRRGQVVGTDFCAEMLKHAPDKAKAAGLEVDFQLADAMNLPFADALFDISSIAYGIRNVNDPVKALSEMARVVKPGGAVMVLETGDSPQGGLKPFFDFYFSKVVPRIGGWVTGKRSAYEYLNRSSRGFPSRDGFVRLMQETGRFSSCEYRVLMGGASFIYKGVVRPPVS